MAKNGFCSDLASQRSPGGSFSRFFCIFGPKWVLKKLPKWTFGGSGSGLFFLIDFGEKWFLHPGGEGVPRKKVQER